MKRLALIIALVAAAIPAPAQAGHGPTVWTLAMVIYDSLDVECPTGRHVRNALTQAQLDEATTRSRKFRSQVRKWSSNKGRVHLTFFYPGTATSAHVLNDRPDECWISPGDVQRMGHWPTGFDSVHIQYPKGLTTWNGLAKDGELPYGSTYSTSHAWVEGDWYWHRFRGAKLMVHEWLHGSGGFYRNHFGESLVPRLHDSASYGYPAYPNSSTQWLKDFINGRIWNGSRYIGLTHQIWRHGTPL